jgi:hypothetical protein
MTTDKTVACPGCGALVPDIDGPIHRYMLAAPGCWATYTGLLAGALDGLELPVPHGGLTVDAYAVQHPGTPNPQAIQSVWVHLITLYLALERGWPPPRLVRVGLMGIDAAAGKAWLEPPGSMGPITAIDVATASPSEAPERVSAWVDGAWAAWASRHALIRATADEVVAILG